MRYLGHFAVILVLTALTQIGGLAWLMALWFRYRLVAFFVIYAALTGASHMIAPHFGREPISCWSDGPLRLQSPFYCALNRNYANPELISVATDLASEMARDYPGTETLVLDANFPFLDGFPILPHLSHKDGRKMDVAFWYSNQGTYMPGVTRSPIGYFAFEEGPSDCPDNWLTLRWNLNWLQGIWPDYRLETARLTSALQWLAKDNRVEKIFVEPHLQDTLGVKGDKIRFQGCRAARHDDHLHFQIAAQN